MLEEKDEGQGQEQAPPSWISPDGSFGDMNLAPEGVGEFITSKGFKDISSMTKSHQELESFVGQREKIIRIPDEGDQKGIDEFQIKLGRPIKPEDYKYVIPDEYKEMPMDTGVLDMFKGYAHQRGLSQSVFEDIVNFSLSAAVEQEKAYAETMITERDKAQKVIRGRFNSEDEYNSFTQKALSFADSYKISDGTSAADVLERKGLMHDPEILEVFGSLANSVPEDTLPSGQTSSPQSFDDKLKAIKSNPAFVSPLHHDHKQVMREYRELFKQSMEG